MSKQYIDIPLYTTFNDISAKNFSLSATQYKSFCIKNKNIVTVRDFLSRDLKRSDLGSEVGSEAYVNASKYFFIKTKALQAETYLLDINKESVQNITPMSFINSNLKKGDLLISKDSNVGEIAILDRDYSNTMLCGGIYKLPVIDKKYYLLAFIKNNILRQQIDFLVPRGSTIRHGKTKFLECLIPMPNKNSSDTIKYVELLMEAIVGKEIEIRKKHEKILTAIQEELENNQDEKEFHYSLPSIKEIEGLDRMDSSLYSKAFKEKEFLITNYKHGYASLTDLGYYGVRGTSLENNFIKNRIDSDEYVDGFYKLIIPTNISKHGTVSKITYIGTSTCLKTIKAGDIIFGGEGYGKGKSFVVIEEDGNIATNYHGIRIVCDYEVPVSSKIFVKCVLSYLREQGLIDCYGVGGNGGHFAPAYFHLAKIPNFPESIKQEIVCLYHNPQVTYDASKFTLENFLEYDRGFNINAGIYELDKSMKYLQSKLEQAIECIADDEEVDISF